MRLLGFLVRQAPRLLKVVLLLQKERFEMRSLVDLSTRLIAWLVRHTIHAGEFKAEDHLGHRLSRFFHELANLSRCLAFQMASRKGSLSGAAYRSNRTSLSCLPASFVHTVASYSLRGGFGSFFM